LPESRGERRREKKKALIQKVATTDQVLGVEVSEIYSRPRAAGGLVYF
jgi:hypothetical protein